MPDPVFRRYWDSTVFLEWFQGVRGHADIVEAILDDARKGNCLIFTSTITLVEVTRDRKGPVILSRDIEDKITDFFQNDYIRFVEADRVIGHAARRLVWDHLHLKPRDAVHIASAIQVNAVVIEAYDGDFFKVAKDAPPPDNLPPIREPEWKGQTPLPMQVDPVKKPPPSN